MSKLVTIASYGDLSMAYLAWSKLEGSGIPCFLGNEFLVGVHWLYSNAVGGVELKVPESAAQAAMELLAEETGLTPDTAEAPMELETEVPAELELVCPQCGGADIEIKNPARAFAIFSFIIGFPLPFSRERRHCKKCGHVWK